MTQLQKIVAKAKSLKKSYPKTKWTDLIKKASKLVTPASKSVGAVKKKRVIKKKSALEKLNPAGYGKYMPDYKKVEVIRKPIISGVKKKKAVVKRSTTRSIESNKIRAKVKKDGFIMPHGYEVSKGKRGVSGIKKKYTEKQLEKLADDYAYVTSGDLDRALFWLFDPEYTETLIPKYEKAIKDYEIKHNVKISGIKRKKATKKAIKKSPARSMHKDTKSHNVNIRVMSGIDKTKFYI